MSIIFLLTIIQEKHQFHFGGSYLVFLNPFLFTPSLQLEVKILPNVKALPDGKNATLVTSTVLFIMQEAVLLKVGMALPSQTLCIGTPSA